MGLHLDREDQVAVGATAYWISESAQTDLFSGCNIARDLDAEVLGLAIPAIEFELDLAPFDDDAQWTEISAVTSPGEVDGDCGEYLDEESGEELDRRDLERDRAESPVA